MLSVVIVDDCSMFREAFSSLLQQRGDFNVLYCASDGCDLMEKFVANAQKPDVILMDLQMPGLTGIEATALITKMNLSTKVILMSVLEHEHVLINGLAAGGSGFVSKYCDYTILSSAINNVHQGLRFIARGRSSINSSEEISYFNRIEHKESPVLSGRRKEFLRLCATGMTYKEIATQMGISPKTADSYREQLFHLLQIKSRVSLVIYALQTGIISLSEIVSDFTSVNC
jgi:two-component system invasion response regulator UvrY